MDGFRFIFMGTGTSGGIPIIACDCVTCRSEDPRDNRTRQGACVQWVDPRGHARTVLIDATPDLREQALRHDLWRCDAILFTHHHVDHIFGLDEVRRFNLVMRAPIDVYAEHATMKNLNRVYKHIFERSKNVNDSFVATLVPHLIEPEAPVDLWGMRFLPMRLLHGKLPILGFRIEPVPGAWGRKVELGGGDVPLPLAYCTDVSGIPTQTWAHLEGLDTLVLDALRIRHHPTHFNLSRAVEVAGDIGARQTWFVHLAHEINHAEVDPTLPEGMSLPWDGLTLGAAEAPVGRETAGELRPEFDEG